jgi:hypothetical protein
MSVARVAAGTSQSDRWPSDVLSALMLENQGLGIARPDGCRRLTAAAGTDQSQSYSLNRISGSPPQTPYFAPMT